MNEDVCWKLGDFPMAMLGISEAHPLSISTFGPQKAHRKMEGFKAFPISPKKKVSERVPVGFASRFCRKMATLGTRNAGSWDLKARYCVHNPATLRAGWGRFGLWRYHFCWVDFGLFGDLVGWEDASLGSYRVMNHFFTLLVVGWNFSRF